MPPRTGRCRTIACRKSNEVAGDDSPNSTSLTIPIAICLLAANREARPDDTSAPLRDSPNASKDPRWRCLGAGVYGSEWRTTRSAEPNTFRSLKASLEGSRPLLQKREFGCGTQTARVAIGSDFPPFSGLPIGYRLNFGL